MAQADLPVQQAALFCQILDTRDARGLPLLSAVDRGLETFAEPSFYNAVLMMARGDALVASGREQEGAKAFSDALTLYPDAAVLQLNAVMRLAHTAHFAQAADYWIALARNDPAMARLPTANIVDGVVGRLSQAGDMARLGRLVDALDSADYVAEDPLTRSWLGMISLEMAVNRGQPDMVRRALRRVGDPARLSVMAADDLYRDYWPDLGWETAEQRQATMQAWATDLVNTAHKDRAHSGGMMANLLPYIGPEPFLAAYEQQLLDELAARPDPKALFDLAFWVSPLANARQMTGDVAGAERIYQAALAAYAGFDNPARFNVDANYARMLVEEGRHAEALAMIDATIRDLSALDRRNPALLPMHAVHVRALHGLGRLPEDDPSLVLVRGGAGGNFRLVVTTLLQIGDLGEARRLVIERLRQPNNYRAALEILQPSLATYATADAARRDALFDQLRTDRAVRRALERRGRLLDQGPLALPDIVLPDLSGDALPVVD